MNNKGLIRILFQCNDKCNSCPKTRFTTLSTTVIIDILLIFLYIYIISSYRLALIFSLEIIYRVELISSVLNWCSMRDVTDLNLTGNWILEFSFFFW